LDENKDVLAMSDNTEFTILAGASIEDLISDTNTMMFSEILANLGILENAPIVFDLTISYSGKNTASENVTVSVDLSISFNMGSIVSISDVRLFRTGASWEGTSFNSNVKHPSRLTSVPISLVTNGVKLYFNSIAIAGNHPRINFNSVLATSTGIAPDYNIKVPLKVTNNPSPTLMDGTPVLKVILDDTEGNTIEVASSPLPTITLDSGFAVVIPPEPIEVDGVSESEVGSV
jgi:hypothetical protein